MTFWSERKELESVDLFYTHTGQWFLPFIHNIDNNNDDYDENNNDNNNGCSKRPGTNGAVTLLRFSLSVQGINVRRRCTWKYKLEKSLDCR